MTPQSENVANEGPTPTKRTLGEVQYVSNQMVIVLIKVTHKHKFSMWVIKEDQVISPIVITFHKGGVDANLCKSHERAPNKEKKIFWRNNGAWSGV